MSEAKIREVKGENGGVPVTLASLLAPREGANFAQKYAHLDAYVLVSAGRWPNMLSPRAFKSGDRMTSAHAHLLNMRRGHSAGSVGARKDTLDDAFAAVQSYELPSETWTAKDEIADAYVQHCMKIHAGLKAFGTWDDRKDFRHKFLSEPDGGKYGNGFPAFVKSFLTEDTGASDKPAKKEATKRGFDM